MIDDPWTRSSSSRSQPSAAAAIRSWTRRDRSTPSVAQCGDVQLPVRGGDRVVGVADRLGEAQRAGGEVAVERVAAAGEGGGAEGAAVEAPQRAEQPVDVASHQRRSGGQVVPERRRLGRLVVGGGDQDRVDVGGGEVEEHRQQVELASRHPQQTVPGRQDVDGHVEVVARQPQAQPCQHVAPRVGVLARELGRQTLLQREVEVGHARLGWRRRQVALTPEGRLQRGDRRRVRPGRIERATVRTWAVSASRKAG
jgi:hypothetical protein